MSGLHPVADRGSWLLFAKRGGLFRRFAAVSQVLGQAGVASMVQIRSRLALVTQAANFAVAA
jgi:hypothetical protein